MPRSTWPLRWLSWRWLFKVAALCGLSAPAAVWLLARSKSLQAFLTFLNAINFPRIDLRRPATPQLFYSGLKRARNIEVDSNRGRLHGWHISPTNTTAQPAFCVLYFHGNGGNRATRHRVQLYDMLTNSETGLGAHVITFDYRGFGDSTFCPATHNSAVESVDEETLHEDACAAWSFARAKFPSMPMVILGHSLGSVVAIRLAETLAATAPFLDAAGPAALVLEGALTCAKDVVLANIPKALHSKWLSEQIDRALFFKLASNERIGDVTAPLCVVHGMKDTVIPYSQGYALQKKAAQASTSSLVLVPGATHDTALLHPVGKRGLAAFLQHTGCDNSSVRRQAAKQLKAA
eukprot:g63017.t1